MDELTQKIIDAKRLHRKRLAKLPIAEKIRILVELQKIARPLLEARGKQALVWDIEDENKREPDRVRKALKKPNNN